MPQEFSHQFCWKVKFRLRDVCACVSVMHFKENFHVIIIIALHEKLFDKDTFFDAITFALFDWQHLLSNTHIYIYLHPKSKCGVHGIYWDIFKHLCIPFTDHGNHFSVYVYKALTIFACTVSPRRISYIVVVLTCTEVTISFATQTL